jgi:photosystem II stability/assembly factor-like uncharacterized protein
VRTLLTLLATIIISSGTVGAQWRQASKLPSDYIYTLAANDSDLYVGGYYMGLYVSRDNGASWTEIDSGLGKEVNVRAIITCGPNLFVGAAYVGVYASTNAGTNWTSVDSGLKHFNISISALAASHGNIFAGNGDGVYLSTNNGMIWTQVNSGLTNTDIRSFLVHDSNLFAGAANNGNVFFSTNNGLSWTERDSGLSRPNVTYVTSLAGMGDNILASTSGAGVFISADNGITWNEIDAGLINYPNKFVDWVGAVVVSGTNIFANTGAGVFLSTDIGNTWNDVSSGLTFGPTTPPSCLVVSKNELVVGTSGHGVWHRSLTEMITSVRTNNENLPTSFILYQNYPNPFNPSTKITFDLPSRCFVTLKIYDALGRKLSTLLSGEKLSGNYSYQWNAKSFPSGVYFCRFQADSFTETKKLILLR